MQVGSSLTPTLSVCVVLLLQGSSMILLNLRHDIVIFCNDHVNWKSLSGNYYGFLTQMGD